MLNILTKVYKLGYTLAKYITLKEVEHVYSEYKTMAKAAYTKTKGVKGTPKVTDAQHQAAADAVYDVLSRLDPKKYPSVQLWLEKK